MKLNVPQQLLMDREQPERKLPLLDILAFLNCMMMKTTITLAFWQQSEWTLYGHHEVRFVLVGASYIVFDLC